MGKPKTVAWVSRIQESVSAESEISQTPSDKFEPMLSWSHYCELLKVEQHLGRSFYGLTEDPYFLRQLSLVL